jgi:hypothetical protein
MLIWDRPGIRASISRAESLERKANLGLQAADAPGCRPDYVDAIAATGSARLWVVLQ